MRTILGPIKLRDNEYRQRMNCEIEQELEREDIVRKIKTATNQMVGTHNI